MNGRHIYFVFGPSQKAMKNKPHQRILSIFPFPKKETRSQILYKKHCTILMANMPTIQKDIDTIHFRCRNKIYLHKFFARKALYFRPITSRQNKNHKNATQKLFHQPTSPRRNLPHRKAHPVLQNYRQASAGFLQKEPKLPLCLGGQRFS